MRHILACLFVVTVCCEPVLAQNHNLIRQADSLILNSALNEALTLLDREDPGSQRDLSIANKRAEVLIRLGNLAAAEKELHNIEAQLIRAPESLLQAVTNTNLGFLQLNQGRHDLAEQSLRTALSILERDTLANRHQVATTLSVLGLVYLSQGKYTQAQEQLHRVLYMRRQARGGDAFVAAAYNDLGLAYSQTDKDRALDYYRQAHKMYLSLYGEHDPRIAVSNINAGIIYRDLGRFDDAITNFETALGIWNRAYRQAHAAKAIALYNLGLTYVRLNDQRSAAEYYTLALKMYRDVYGAKHPEIASVLNAIGNLHLEQGEFDEAFAAYQEALKANIPGFNTDDYHVNPPLKDYYNGVGLLHTLLFKAQAFEARYKRRSLKFSELSEALKTLASCDSLIDQLRQHSTNESDKLLLGVVASELYADGVRIAYLAGLNAVKKEPYFEKAFYFAEKSKGAVLLESISDADAKSFAGIPSELLEEEKAIRSALSVAAQKLAQKPDEAEEALLREASFGLKKKYDAFIERLEKTYPAYFNLKYNVTTPSVAQLQALLNEQTALISYFIDDKDGQLYIFMVRPQHFKVWQTPLIPDFDKYITGLRNSLYFQEINTFKTSASLLGKMLVPNIPSQVTDLVILPTGRLALIPFEALLTADPKKAPDYTSLPYLLDRYSIRYELSAGLLTQKVGKDVPAARPSILLCAPVHFPHKPYLSELPGTLEEVAAISKLFSEKQYASTVLTLEDAREQRIKSESMKGFQYVHFATHGIVDEEHPELSRVFLLGDAENDGDLFAGEIYNLELDANLVTLSACQTGLGKLLKGEGVIGLSRALAYAGARNIMVSFWNVADESTSQLMRDFYDRLLRTDRTSHADALRRAKLALIASTKFSAPYYWAPFVLIGF